MHKHEEPREVTEAERQAAAEQAKSLAREYLQQCCVELKEWRDTGILRDGYVRKITKILQHVYDGYSTCVERMAELIVNREAIAKIAEGNAVNYPVVVAPHIYQFTEGTFIWYDEAGLPGGVTTTLEDAERALRDYGKKLDAENGVRSDLFYCHGKGGVYELLGESNGAGLCRPEIRMIYRDTETRKLYHRSREDFNDRMRPYKPSQKGEKQ